MGTLHFKKKHEPSLKSSKPKWTTQNKYLRIALLVSVLLNLLLLVKHA